MRTSKLLLVLLALLLVPTLASAQAVTSYNIALNGGTAVSIPVAAGGFVCGVTPKTVAVAGVTNPTRISVDDPSQPTVADCVYTDPGTGILRTLPFGATSYTATATATNAAGTSALSAASLPFTRPGSAPGAPTGIRLARSWFPFPRLVRLVG